MSSPSDRLKPSPPASFFFAIAWAQKEPHTEVEQLLASEFGPLDDRSQMYCFSDFSTYYDAELGDQVWKYLVSLRRPMPADRIVQVKLWTESLEDRFSRGKGDSRKRTVNLDPGYLNGWQVVLSTVKNHAHRISMGSGVFCEVTLTYQEGRFRELPWTYADYSSRPVLDFLESVRGRYRR